MISLIVTSFGADIDVAGFDPRGLAVDNSGVVYVCDFSNKSMQPLIIVVERDYI